MTRHIRHVLMVCGLLYALVLLAPLAMAGTATLRWTAPTQDTAGRALAANAITKYQIAWAWNAIPDNATASTQGVTWVDVTGATNKVVTVNVPADGGTFHARVKACAGATCSAFSAEATKVFAAQPVVPAVPTQIGIEFQE